MFNQQGGSGAYSTGRGRGRWNGGGGGGGGGFQVQPGGGGGPPGPSGSYRGGHSPYNQYAPTHPQQHQQHQQHPHHHNHHAAASALPQKAKSFKNLYVGGLPKEASDGDLHALFSKFGPIRSAKVMLNVDTGASRGYGFVLYGKEEEGAAAFATLNKQETEVAGIKAVLDVRASRHDGRQASAESQTIYVRNLPCAVPEEEIRAHFQKFGSIETFVLRPQPTPQSSANSVNSPSRKETQQQQQHDEEEEDEGGADFCSSAQEGTGDGSSGKADATAALTGGLLLGTISFHSTASARDAIDATHSQHLWPQCTLPVLAKFAESKQVRDQRKARRMIADASANPESYDSSGATPHALHDVGKHGAAVAPPPTGSGSNTTAAPPPPPASALYPGAVRLPLERRSGLQFVFYQGVLGLTPDGILYPVQPEVCHYVNTSTVTTSGGSGPAWAGAPLSQSFSSTPTVPTSMMMGLSQNTPSTAGSSGLTPQAMLVLQAQQAGGSVGAHAHAHAPPPPAAHDHALARWNTIGGHSPGPMET